MKIQIVKAKSFQAVGPQGPFLRVFKIGDVVELPELHAQMLVAEGSATKRISKIETPQEDKPVRKISKKK